jgi:hypothetical protein
VTRRRRWRRREPRARPSRRAWRPPCPPRTSAARRRDTGTSARSPSGSSGSPAGAPAGGEDVPAAPLMPGMDRMAGSSMSPSEPNEDRRTCPCVGGCATGTVVPGGGYTGCPCGVVSTVPRSGDPTGVAGASESVSNGPSPSDPPARESPSSPSFAFAPERGLNARLSLSRTQDVMPGPAPPAPPTRKVAHASEKVLSETD